VINITKYMIEEDKLINAGFLTVSIAIVISSLNASLVGKQLVPLIMCSIAIPPLAFNAFVIEYKKRFKVDGRYWGYDLMVASGFILTFLGLAMALALKSYWAFGAFLIGVLLTFPSAGYLNKLVKLNKSA